MLRLSTIIVALLVGAAGCEDPVRQSAIAALGPEDPRVRPGPLHRPGQPCLLCHDHENTNGALFSVAGTVYVDPRAQVPAADVDVVLVDSDGHAFTAKTNCAGNFFVTERELLVHYPLWVSLSAGPDSPQMESPIYREGSCAACHTSPAGPTSAGPVYLWFEPQKAAPPRCP